MLTELTAVRRALKPYVVYAGHFGGVDAGDVLDRLVEPQDKDVPVARAVMFCLDTSSKLSDTLPKFKRLLKQKYADDAQFSSMLEWPKEFWFALRRAAKHRVALQYTTGLSTPIGLAPEIALMAGFVYEHSGQNSPSEDTLAYERISGMINLVLKHLPPQFEKVARNIQYQLYIPDFKKTPKATRRITQIHSKFNVDLRISESDPNFDESPDCRGYWYDETNVIGLREGATPEVVAHEIGHAIWSFACDRDWLIRQLTRTMKKCSQVAKDIDDFRLSMQRALQGIHLGWASGHNTRRDELLKEVADVWGNTYLELHSSSARVPTDPLYQLRMLLKNNDAANKLTNSLILDDKANHFLVAWDEHWAEGFVRVLLHKSTDIKVPGVIIGLIQQLLSV